MILIFIISQRWEEKREVGTVIWLNCKTLESDQGFLKGFLVKCSHLLYPLQIDTDVKKKEKKIDQG